MFTEESIKNNPGMSRLVAKALAKENRPPIKFKLQELQALQKELSPKQNKYGVDAIENRTHPNGTVFATKGELQRWDYLSKLEYAGEIRNLEMQVPFILQEGFISKQKEWGDTKPILYVADFVYTNVSYRKGYEERQCVEDCKGSRDVLTKEYKVKRRMFLYKFGRYAFFEVYPDS